MPTDDLRIRQLLTFRGACLALQGIVVRPCKLVSRTMELHSLANKLDDIVTRKPPTYQEVKSKAEKLKASNIKVVHERDDRATIHVILEHFEPNTIRFLEGQHAVGVGYYDEHGERFKAIQFVKGGSEIDFIEQKVRIGFEEFSVKLNYAWGQLGQAAFHIGKPFAPGTVYFHKTFCPGQTNWQRHAIDLSESDRYFLEKLEKLFGSFFW